MNILDNILVLVIGMLIGIIIVASVVDYKWKHNNEIVKQGCGQYNSTTGNFEWIKK